MKNIITITAIATMALVIKADSASNAQSMIDQIMKQRESIIKRANENYSKTVDPIVERHKKILENAIQKAKKKARLRLELAKKEAAANGDEVAVAKFENAIVQLSEKKTAQKKDEKASEAGGWGQQEEVRTENPLGITEPIDLLKLMDIQKNVVQGKWTRDGTSLAVADQDGHTAI